MAQMVYNNPNILNKRLKQSQRRLRSISGIALAGLVLAITAPKGARGDDSPTSNNNGLESFAKAPDFNSSNARLIKSQIKEMAGRIVIDSQLEVTQPLQVDKKLTFISLSTPTATPSAGHADMWLNNSTKQICTKFDDGSAGCLATGGASGTITSVTAGLGLNGGGASGGVTVGLSTPITSSYIPDYISATSVAVATAAVASATTTLRSTFNTYTSTVSVVLTAIGVSTAAIAVDTGTFLTKSSATASYIANSTLAETKTLNVSSGTLTNLNTTTLKFADGTTQTSAAAGFASVTATQTWSGLNTFVSSTTFTYVSVSSVTNSSSTQVAGFQSYQLLYSSTVFDVTGTSITTLGTFVPTKTAVTFTPRRASSRVEVSYSGALATNSGSVSDAFATIFRNSTNIVTAPTPVLCQCNVNSAIENACTCSGTYIDVPNTASALTYTVEIAAQTAGTQTIWNAAGTVGTITVKEWSY